MYIWDYGKRQASMSNPSQILFTGQYSGTVVNSSKLDDGLIAGITSYTENKFNPEFHYHENPHLSLVLQGGNIENRKSGSIERKAGALIFYRSGELHQTLPATTVSKNINLEIENSFLIKYDISEKNFDCISLGRPQNVLSFVKIYNEIYLNDSLSDTSIQMLTISIINSKKKEAAKKPEWAIKLHEVLHDQWDQSHSLDYLSKITNVHPVTISKYFINYFGCTIGEYMRKLKISQSLPLIRSGKYSLTDVAMTCGFADQSHFTRNFKAYTGFLPKEFKKL